jgi:hypothetical protein
VNHSRPWQLDEAFEFADAGGVAHFAEGFGFDLADALAGYIGKLLLDGRIGYLSLIQQCLRERVALGGHFTKTLDCLIPNLLFRVG